MRRGGGKREQDSDGKWRLSPVTGVGEQAPSSSTRAKADEQPPVIHKHEWVRGDTFSQPSFQIRQVEHCQSRNDESKACSAGFPPVHLPTSSWAACSPRSPPGSRIHPRPNDARPLAETRRFLCCQAPALHVRYSHGIWWIIRSAPAKPFRTDFFSLDWIGGRLHLEGACASLCFHHYQANQLTTLSLGRLRTFEQAQGVYSGIGERG